MLEQRDHIVLHPTYVRDSRQSCIGNERLAWRTRNYRVILIQVERAVKTIAAAATANFPIRQLTQSCLRK
jgi:hypothetical protein